MPALLSRFAPIASPTLSVADTAALIRKGTWPRVVFSVLSVAIAMALAPIPELIAWTAFVIVWELALRPRLDALAVQSGARDGAWLALINLFGATAYCVFPVLVWSEGGVPGKLLAVAWGCASTSHVVMFFSGRPAILAGNLAPLTACGVAAALTLSGAASPLAVAGLLVVVIGVAASGLVGSDRRDVVDALSRARVARATVEEARAAKTRFLALASHELRTPLNAIIGYAEMIAEAGDSHADDALRVRAAAHRLLDIVNGMLEVSQVEAGIGALCPTRGSVAALLEALRREGAPLAAVRNNRFSVVMEGDAGDANLDWPRLRQSIMHLVSNAAKFTTDGAIDVTVRRGRRKGREALVFQVRDTGIGIAPELQAQMFEPFVQGDESSARQHDGAGLGLASARLMARLMGGDVTCESRPGAGATFSLWVNTDA